MNRAQTVGFSWTAAILFSLLCWYGLFKLIAIWAGW